MTSQQYEEQTYPNPASDWIEIESTSNKKYTLILSDLAGKIINNYDLVGSMKVDMTDLQRGVYFLKITREDSLSEIRKIIKH